MKYFAGMIIFNLGLSQTHPSFNSLWPSHTIRRHRSGSTLAQVMTCCLAAPSHYMNQCWHLVSEVFFFLPSLGNKFTVSAQTIIVYYKFENYSFEIIAISTRGQWVDTFLPTIYDNTNSHIYYWLNCNSHQYAVQSCYNTVNTLRPRQNGRHFPDSIFECIFLNENIWISLKISLKFVSKGPIYNIPALVQSMAWCLPGGKPLSEQMMVSLLTHMCHAASII